MKLRIKNISKLSIYLVFFLLLAYYFVSPVHADDINQKILDLRKQIADLTKQADQYKKTIVQNHQQADTLARQISILNNSIAKLQTEITITEKQISTAKLQISDLETKVFDTQEQINNEKATVSNLLFLTYKRDQLSLTTILLQNPSLSNFANISHQEQNLNSKLLVLLDDLKQKKDQLQQEKSDLEAQKRNLEDLNSKNITQKNIASENKQNKDSLLVQTKGKEQQYQKLLTEAEKKEAEFFSQLKSLEDEAVKSGAFIVHITAASIPPKGTKIFRWPEDVYYITQGYGMTAYARRGGYGGAPHNGVDTSGGYGTPIHAGADGAILASGFNDGWGNWVAIRHSNGLVTLYAHMRSPSGLANSTSVTTSSIIGYEGNTGNVTGSHLHFSVYRDFFTYINNKNSQLYFNYFDGSLNPLDYL